MANSKVVLYMRKFAVPILSTIILLTIMIAAFFQTIGESGFTTLIPIDSMGIQAISIFIFLSIASIIGVLLGLVLGPFLLFMHAKIIGRKKTYSIQERPHPTGFGGFKRGFFPALMAIDFSMHFAGLTLFKDLLLDADWVLTDSGLVSWPFVSLIILLIPTLVISMGLFSAVWILQDTGLVYKTGDEASNSSEPIETRSAGGWYMSILRGYAGVGAIFGFYTFVMTALSFGSIHISVPLILIAMPIILMIMAAPGLVLFDIIQERMQENTKRLAQKYVK